MASYPVNDNPPVLFCSHRDGTKTKEKQRRSQRIVLQQKDKKVKKKILLLPHVSSSNSSSSSFPSSSSSTSTFPSSTSSSSSCLSSSSSTSSSPFFSSSAQSSSSSTSSSTSKTPSSPCSATSSLTWSERLSSSSCSVAPVSASPSIPSTTYETIRGAHTHFTIQQKSYEQFNRKEQWIVCWRMSAKRKKDNPHDKGFLHFERMEIFRGHWEKFIRLIKSCIVFFISLLIVFLPKRIIMRGFELGSPTIPWLGLGKSPLTSQVFRAPQHFVWNQPRLFGQHSILWTIVTNM